MTNPIDSLVAHIRERSSILRPMGPAEYLMSCVIDDGVRLAFTAASESSGSQMESLVAGLQSILDRIELIPLME